MDKDEALKLWGEIQSNLQILDACERPHEFVSVDPSISPFKAKYRCIKCNGVIDYNAKTWYGRDLRHGKLPGQQ